MDFGGQYKELIARRIREMHVLSIIKPGDMPVDEIKKMNPIGIVLTGGPNSVYGENAPTCDKALFELGIPILGICYGMQLMAYKLDGEVVSCNVSEYGKIDTEITGDCVLFDGMDKKQVALMSHTDYVKIVPTGFKAVAKTKDCPTAAMANDGKKLYAVQFHPEVQHTENGKEMLKNFVFGVCGATGDYTMEGYIEEQIKAVRETVGNEAVILGLSGGVDSSVVAALLSKAIGSQLVCIFVDHGLMRKNEGDDVEAAFKPFDLRFIRANAKTDFWKN